jgi:phospholipid/cholesterol/gamma-HCH transport system substrate-binding protein
MTLHRGDPRVAGVLALVGILLLVLIAAGINASFGLPGNLRLGWPPVRDYTLHAAFADANGLIRGAGVQVAGAPIGQVTEVRAAGRQAVVGMRIEHRYAPLHAGTVARIRYSTLLAQKYVELSPAAGTPPLADGSTIPSDQTITPVDFDQFLSTLDPETRRQAQVLVQQLGGGVQGRGETLNLLLDQLSGLAGESRAGLSTLDSHDADLSSITANLAVTSRRLSESRQQLGDLVANTASVAGTLSANDRSLDDLLVHLARTSEEVDQTLNGNEGNLRTTVTTLDPLLVGLNDNLATTYPYLHGSQADLRAAFDSLIPSIGSAIAQRDAGGNFLRQYLVLDTCYDVRSGARANPTTGTNCLANVSLSGPAPGPDSHAPPAAPPATGPAARTPGSSGKLPATPAPCPSPLIGLPPVPLPSPLPPVICPSPSPTPCVPVPSPTPAPRPSPSPSPSPGCTSVVGGVVGGVTQAVPVPLPSAVGALLGIP